MIDDMAEVIDTFGLLTENVAGDRQPGGWRRSSGRSGNSEPGIFGAVIALVLTVLLTTYGELSPLTHSKPGPG